MIELGPVENGSSPIEELMELTAQSLSCLEVKEHFNVIKEIGRGKYGRVMLVTHRRRGTPMALKLLPKASTQLKGFLREYCISLRLSCHPCVVSLFGIAFQSDEHYGFVQELVVGRDLFSIIKPRIGISERAVKRCAVQIASALEFIHCQGLVHRDIKPENVLLLDSQCRHVKLADFGLTQKRGTLICFISSTLPYMAPELCEMVVEDGQENPKAPPLSIQPSLDTWAFGVLLFCILTGFFPWEYCTSADSFYEEFADWQKDTETAEFPTQWKRFTPACMEMFVKLLALEPNDRSTADVVKGYVGKDWVRPKCPNGLVGEIGGVSAMATLSNPCCNSSVLP